MRGRLFVIGLTAFLLAITSPLHAQQAQAPLLMMIAPERVTTDFNEWLGGDLWSWSAAGLKQQTDWQFNYSPVISPDGRHIAYRSLDRIFVEQHDLRQHPESVSGWETPSIFPVNIWLMNADTGEATRIADQKSTFDPNLWINILRSDPTWAPDSSAVAWSELTTDGQGKRINQIVIYDLATKSSKTLPLDIDTSKMWYPAAVSVEWCDLGLAIRLIDSVPASDPNRNDKVIVYSPEGKELYRFGVGSWGTDWIKDNGKTVLVIHQRIDNQPHDVLLDPQTGQRSDFNGTLVLYSLSAPDGVSVYQENGGWVLARPDDTKDRLGVAGSITISPDGKQVAYLRFPPDNDRYPRIAFVYGITSPIAEGNVVSIAWGATGWRVKH